MGSDRFARDVLHDEIRKPVGRRTGIEQARDVGMIESRQNATLGVKPAQNFICVRAALENLDRHFALEGTVGPLGQVNRAHSTAAQFAHDLVGADSFAGRAERLLRFE